MYRIDTLYNQKELHSMGIFNCVSLISISTGQDLLLPVIQSVFNSFWLQGRLGNSCEV